MSDADFANRHAHMWPRRDELMISSANGYVEIWRTGDPELSVAVPMSELDTLIEALLVVSNHLRRLN